KDSNGKWMYCKYNAMWNMFWRARLVRWQPVELPVVQAILGAALTLSGAESFVGWVAKRFPFSGNKEGIAGKGITDALKACYTNIGRGVAGTGAPREGPIS